MQSPGDGKGSSGGSEEEKSLLEKGSDTSSGSSEASKPKRAQSVRTFRVKDDYWKDSERPLLAEGSSDTTGSTGTPPRPGGARLKRLDALPLDRHEGYQKLGEESDPKSPKKETVPPEKRPLLSEEPSGTTGVTEKPPKPPKGTTAEAGLKQKISKAEGYERLDKGKSPTFTPRDPIVFGVFTGKDGHRITREECGAKCKAHFGEMYLPDHNIVPFALPFIITDKKTNSVRCNCTMNAEQIRDLLLQTELSRNYYTFQQEFAKKSFCHARVWLYTRDFQRITVDIPYELESKKLKSPKERAKFSRLESISGQAHVSPDYFRRKLQEDEEQARLDRLEEEKKKKAEASSKDPSKKGKEVAEISPEEEEQWKALVERNENKKKEGASENPAEKGKDVAQVNPEEEKIIVGAFPRSKDEGFTDESCKATCQEFFGEIELTIGVRTSFTKPEVLENGNTCSCFVNPRLSWWAEVTKFRLEFLEKFRHFYCFGQTEFENYDIFLQYEMDAHPNRKSKRPKVDIDTYNREVAERAKGALQIMRGRPHKDKPQPKKTAEAAGPPQILLGTIQRSSWKNKLSTLTPEKCQKKCNERFGYILQEPPKAESSSVGIPPGNPNLPPNAPQKSPQNVPPEVSQKPSRIPFTTAKVSDDKSECKCYFNRGQILPYLKTRITNYSSWESVFFYYLTGKPFGYDDGVTHLKKEQIKVVNENGSEKIVHNRFDKSEKNPPETKPTKPN
ncbi:uncharacterized protein [Bemisia tabaci]